MKSIRIDGVARGHMREIHKYSKEHWGAARANEYIRELSARFDDIAAGRAHSRTVPAIFGVDGHFCRGGSHLIYWRSIDQTAIAIVAVIHERMHQRERVRQAFERSP